MNNKIIACDFDGTLCENKWPDIGSPNLKLISYLKDQQEQGSKIILWTCRTRERLDEAVRFCFDHDLVFDAINDNIPETLEWFDGDSRKIFAHVYIDDRAGARFNLPFTPVSDRLCMPQNFNLPVNYTKWESSRRDEKGDKYD